MTVAILGKVASEGALCAVLCSVMRICTAMQARAVRQAT